MGAWVCLAAMIGLAGGSMPGGWRWSSFVGFVGFVGRGGVRVFENTRLRIGGDGKPGSIPGVGALGHGWPDPFIKA